MRFGWSFVAIAWCSILSVASPTLADGPVTPEPAIQRAAPIARLPWTSSRVHGSPDPASPYRIQLAFPHLKFLRPIEITAAPGTERLFVAELDGKVYSFPNDPNCTKPDLVFDVVKEIPGATRIYGLTFHPRFAENRYAYLCYVLKDEDPLGTRVARFEVTRDDPPRFIASTEKRLIIWFCGGHNGGCLRFGPDGYLYIATGDGTAPSPPDGLDTGQDNTDLLSCVLRIDVDHADGDQPYRIPKDNPFLDREDTRPEIWAYGFRNPWKMSFDRANGDLWAGDVGWELWEMVYHIERGGNYGWSVMEGRQPVRPESRRGPTPILPPVVDHPHSEAASVTGGYVYRGKQWPELNGVYIYGDYVTGKIWGLRYDGKKVTWHQELVDTPLQIIAYGETNAGELYVMDYESTGQIYRLEPNPQAGQRGDFPLTLSETGLFRSVADHEVASGLIPYSVNAPLWSDYATAERYLALPGTGRISFDNQGVWKFPEGAVLAKTLSLEMRPGDPASRRRIETQLLHFEDGNWRPYTYAWNETQDDATLVESGGAEATFVVEDASAPGGRREQTWRFAGRTECSLCHNPWTHFVPGMDLGQLTREHSYRGTVADQVATWEQLGLFAGDLPKASQPSALLADPYDPALPVEARARAYLHVNCAHCHRDGGGGTATIRLVHGVKPADMGAIDARPVQGAFGISDARIIAPGDPSGSVLLYRLAKLGHGRMPRAGSNLIDVQAVNLIRQWIEQMDEDRTRRPEDEAAATIVTAQHDADGASRRQALEQLTASTRGALALLNVVQSNHLPQAVHEEIIFAAAAHPAPEVRDLFERFLPESQRTKRLGSVVNVSELLALEGDAARGRAVFLQNEAAQCKTCHRIGIDGGQVGPELTQIGKKYSPAELIEQILEPSKKMEPQYTPYVIETVAGQVLTGILVKRSEQEIVLRDAQDKLITLRASEVERMVPQQKSLMPELLLRDMTPQDVADLLAYLAGLK